MTMMLRRCLQFPLSCASSACMLLSIRTSTRQSHGEDTLLKNVVDLRPGVPGDDELKKCSGILQRAVAHRLADPNAFTLFQYGPVPGDKRFAVRLAEFLTKEYKNPVSVSDLVVTAGATHGLSLLSSVAFSPGDTVFVESPTYYLAMNVLKTSGLKIVPVPMDDQGVIVEQLERLFAEHLSKPSRPLTDKKPFSAMFYSMTVFHNPTGINLSPNRCRRVIALARKFNVLVMCDDVYNLLWFPQADGSPKRLFAYDNKEDPDYKGNVVSNGSFSKIFGPGVRLGWLEAPEQVVNLVCTSGVGESGGGFNHTMSGLIESVLSLNLLSPLVEEKRELCKAACDAFCETLLSKVPPNEVSIMKPQGGYFLWIKLTSISAKDLLEETGKYDVKFFLGALSSVEGNCFDDHIRVSFAHYNKGTLVQSAEKIAKALNRLLEKRGAQ